MDKMTAFLLTIIGFLYVLTARILLGSLENVLNKHPLYLYTILVLAGLVIAFRLSGKAVKIFLFFVALIMGFSYFILRG